MGDDRIEARRARDALAAEARTAAATFESPTDGGSYATADLLRRLADFVETAPIVAIEQRFDDHEYQVGDARFAVASTVRRVDLTVWARTSDGAEWVTTGEVVRGQIRMVDR